jgi:hypothetical protein
MMMLSRSISWGRGRLARNEHNGAATIKVARAFERVGIVQDFLSRFHTLESVCYANLEAGRPRSQKNRRGSAQTK